MKVLYYCLRKPSHLHGRLSGPRRSSRIICKAIEQAGMQLTIIDKESYASLLCALLEKEHDIVHTDNPDILSDQLTRGFIPDVIGARNWAPSKYYRDFNGGFYQYPGYENNPDKLYDDAIWIRNNFQEEEFKPSLLKKIRIVQPAIEVDEIFPCTKIKFEERKYILWAGSKARWEKNWHIMDQLMKSIKLPSNYEWLVLDNYEEQEYLSVLDNTALMIYTSQFESFGFQLFEAWAKAVPVIYPQNLWGSMGFNGCGGIPLSGNNNNLESYQSALKDFFGKTITEKENLGKRSREIVDRDFSVARLSRELKIIYQQAFMSKQEPPPLIIP
jgi:hypothetical protein